MANDASAKEARNRQLVEDMYATLNENVLGLMDRHWKPGMVWDGPAGIGVKRGVDEFENDYRAAFIRAFPDKSAADVVRIAEGDWVAGAGFQDATFAEDWLGIPATGNRVRVRYMDFWRIEEDHDGNPKLAENLVLIDILGVLEQAGYDVNAVLRYIGSKPPEHFNAHPADSLGD